MVHGNVRRQLRLGDGSQRLRDEPERGWGVNHDQTVFLRIGLHPENEPLQTRAMVRYLGRTLLALDLEPCRRTWEESAVGNDVQLGQKDGHE